MRNSAVYAQALLCTGLLRGCSHTVIQFTHRVWWINLSVQAVFSETSPDDFVKVNSELSGWDNLSEHSFLVVS